MLQHDTGLEDEGTRKNELVITFHDDTKCLKLMESKGRVLLWEYWRDADAWEFLRYEKQD
jgi:quinol monooxygenase YgiN